jgi:hypothetical protein
MALTLPDGTPVSTGLLLHPAGRFTLMAAYADAGPLLSMTEIITIAKSGQMRGKDRFDSTWVKDQGQFGACAGYAGAGALQRARVRRNLPRVDLSGSYLYSLVNGGRDQGSIPEDGMRAMQTKGIATAATVGQSAIYPSRYDKAKADAEAALYKGFECYGIDSEIELFSALALGFDCVVAVHADNGFMQLDSRGVAGGGNGPGNHAVLCDGLTWNNELIADSMNSWNTSYGDKGRMGLTWSRHFSHTAQNFVYYAIRSTIDGNDSPPTAV